MKKPRDYFNLKGRHAEKLVQELALKTFLVDWCYANPLLPNGKELCDLLVVFDQVAIIWQVKDLKLDTHGRYREAEVKKNLRQLAGARRHLFELKEPIELENPRRHKEVFDPRPITETYLISVLLGEGELVFSPMQLIKTYTAHVFTGDFTNAVLTELDTVGDFAAYLRAKESLFQRDKRIVVMGGEEELLGFYLLNGCSFDSFEAATCVMVDEGGMADLRANPRYVAKKREDEISYGWDDIINKAHTGPADYEAVARELARPTRFQRRLLGKCFFDAHVIADGDGVANAFRRVVSMESVTYCFLYCDERVSREKREAILKDMCWVARGKLRQNSKVVGIATEKHIAPTCSYSLCLLELPEWSTEDQATMEVIQRDFGILVNPSVTQVEEREYPS